MYSTWFWHYIYLYLLFLSTDTNIILHIFLMLCILIINKISSTFNFNLINYVVKKRFPWQNVLFSVNPRILNFISWKNYMHRMTMTFCCDKDLVLLCSWEIKSYGFFKRKLKTIDFLKILLYVFFKLLL